jgi:hypothetical protein
MRHLTVFNAAVLIWLAVGTYAQAWVVPSWSVPQLLNEATLTVVAKPIGAKVVIAKRVLPNVKSGYVDDDHVYVDDVETTFQVLAVVKGDADNHMVILQHLRYTDHRGPVMAGPGLVDFEPGGGKRYLMFLKQEPNGRWVAVSGLLESSSAIFLIN